MNQIGMLGEIRCVAFSQVPTFWASCDGQVLEIEDYQDLYSLLGTSYGGDGITTFALPDLRGRVVIGAGQGVGLSNYTPGQQFGVENVTLDISQIPSHTHAATFTQQSGSSTTPAFSAIGNSDEPTNNVLADVPESSNIYSTHAPNTSLKAGSVKVEGKVDVEYVGGSESHDNMQPTLVLNWIICTGGAFPNFQ